MKIKSIKVEITYAELGTEQERVDAVECAESFIRQLERTIEALNLTRRAAGSAKLYKEELIRACLTEVTSVH